MKTLLAAAALFFAQSEAQNQVIRSIKYENFKGISAEDVASRLKDRGIRIAVEQMYEPQQLESAREALAELLDEKGQIGMTVKALARHVPPRSVEVTFKAEKN